MVEPFPSSHAVSRPQADGPPSSAGYTRRKGRVSALAVAQTRDPESAPFAEGSNAPASSTTEALPNVVSPADGEGHETALLQWIQQALHSLNPQEAPPAYSDRPDSE